MSQSAYPHKNHPIEPKAKNEEEATREMLPFIIYTMIPIVITITIAFVFGSTK